MTETGGLPSLLMEAAHNAAVEDGLAPPIEPVQQQQPQQYSHLQLPQSQPPAAGETTTVTQPGTNNLPSKPGSANAEAVKQAALAMVASGNGTTMPTAKPTPNPGPASGLNGMTMPTLQQQTQLGSINNQQLLAQAPAVSTSRTTTPVTPVTTNVDVSNQAMGSSVSAPATASANPISTATSVLPSNMNPIHSNTINNQNASMNINVNSTTTTNLIPSTNDGASKPSVAGPTSAGSAAHMLAVASSGTAPMQSTTTNTSVPLNPTPPSNASSNLNSAPVPSKPAPAPQPAPSQPVASTAPRSSGSSGGKKKGPPLRRGKWTSEEEAYANRLIMEFKAGLLPLTDGTTLRTFLSKLLNCDPMRISKKFVGSNCIGKQVFRRRTADINRLTPEQIQQSRAELSELERRFLERVAQNNRVKSSGVGNGNSGNQGSSGSAASKVKVEETDTSNSPPTPPWLRAPNGFKHGTGAQTAAATLSQGTMNNKAALVGRALLRDSSLNESQKGLSKAKNDSANLLAFMEMKQRASRQNLANYLGGGSSRTPSSAALLAAAAESKMNRGGLGSSNNLSNAALAQLAQNSSMNNLLRKAGVSRDQLSQLARDQKRNSSNSLSNVLERQSSLEALMSLDLQSLQSIDNLANLLHNGGGNRVNSGLGVGGSQVPRTGMKNWQPNADESRNSSTNLAAIAASLSGASSNNLANARRMASEGRMESLMRSLSSGNVANKINNAGSSNATFSNLLQTVQNNIDNSNSNNHNNNNLLGLGNAASVLSLANMLKVDSSTGLTALRMQDGLAQRNTSVDDFLSLVANGDIPHQDPHMLNVPLQSVLQQQQQQQNNQNGAQAAAEYLARQQLLQSTNGAAALSQRIASLGELANASNSSTASLLNQYSSSQNSLSSNAIAAALQHQARLNASNQHGNSELKRKLDQLDSSDIDLRPAKK